MHKKYQLYDLYELYGEVASCDKLEEIKQKAEQWNVYTDGECNLIIRQWDENLQVYRPFYGSENLREEVTQMDDKAKFVEAVGQALHDYSREQVAKAEYMEIPYTHDGEDYTREIVRITFKDGWQKDIGVSCSSCLAILHDLYKGLL